MKSFLIGAFLLLATPVTAQVNGEPFKNIRIGDQDGFGFTKTKGLLRPTLRNSFGFDFEGGARRSPNSTAADTNGDGILRQGEFLPDLDGDGRVAWFAGDDFDNRAPEEMVDRNNFCRGCLAVHDGTRGSIWTDLALSTGAEGFNWPDEDGPAAPNNASHSACSTTSPSEWAIRPAVWEIFSPPKMTWSPGPKAWTSKPCPIRIMFASPPRFLNSTRPPLDHQAQSPLNCRKDPQQPEHHTPLVPSHWPHQ